MKIYAVIALGLAVSGCGGVGYITEHYSAVDKQEIAMADDTYWVFDRPEERRMAVSSSPGAAFATGTVHAMTFHTVNANPAAVKFEAAAEAFLAKTGRPNCKPTASQFVVTPYYEIKYDCAAPPPAPPAAKPKPSARR